MNEFYSIFIDKKSTVPIYQQLGDALCELIENGVLAPNSKLPPIRTMASQLKVNNVTVVTAYKYLENKKVVYSQMGSGTYVSPIALNKVPEPVVEKNISSFEEQFELEHAINFVNTSMPHSLFPVEEFKTAFNEILDSQKGDAFNYQGSMGYEPLRKSICGYLLESYQIRALPENIQIISGAQQGIDIISKAMMNYGDIIFVEKPTFYGAVGAFLSRGGKVIEIPMEADGIDTITLENFMKLYHPKFLYMMSYFQTPTGISYSMEKKRKILELADKYNTYIIEDDNLYDFYYAHQTIVPLKALDYKNRVLYIKSFSKILMPGLRIGFLMIPKKIMHNVMNAKYTTDISTSGFMQKALDYYFRNNDWKKHIETIRTFSAQKYNKTVKMADKYLKKYTYYQKPEGGNSLWIGLKNDLKAELFCAKLLEKGVVVSPGSQFFIDGEESHHIRICFTNVSEDKIEVGMKRIGECMQSFYK